MDSETRLEHDLSEPLPPVVAALARLDGDLVVLGAAGKMGPTLVAQAVRALRSAGLSRRVVAVARFGDDRVRAMVGAAGAEVVIADLLDPDQVAALPEAASVIFMAGQKFGTTGDAARTWAINAFVPGLVAHRYRESRIVVFSTGNVYPLWPVDSPGPSEQDPVAPIGEYAQSALARERIFEHGSAHYGTRVGILRINYAIEPRYGVLLDIGSKVRNGEPVDLTMGWVNVIWQRDANAIALRALEHCSAPPLIVNVTGRPAARVRDIATAFGAKFGIEPVFRGQEAETALLSDATRCEAMFGAAPTGLEAMIDAVAAWIEQGGRTLAKPTRFDEREGRF